MILKVGFALEAELIEPVQDEEMAHDNCAIRKLRMFINQVLTSA